MYLDSSIAFANRERSFSAPKIHGRALAWSEKAAPEKDLGNRGNSPVEPDGWGARWFPAVDEFNPAASPNRAPRCAQIP
jgi:hypothetical protein